jgi:hypothetical protein
MKLTHHELEYLSAWAREEWEPECYRSPAHQLQLAHKVTGGHLITFIKAWTDGEGKKDQDILNAGTTTMPAWPWSTSEEFHARLDEVRKAAGNRNVVSPNHVPHSPATVP